MALWMVIVGISAVGGAIVLWNTVSRTKAISEQMLRQYSDMLADARKQKSRELARETDVETEAEVVSEPQEG